MMVRFVLAVVLAMMLAGCGLIQTSESPGESGGGLGDLFSGPTSTGPQWSDYMPVQNGRVCTYSSLYTDEEADYASNTVQTSEYTDVREESDGTYYVVKNTFEINTIRESDEYGEADILPTTLEYVLADDGTLRLQPQSFGYVSGLFNFSEDIDISVDNFIVYPPIDVLRQGESHSSSGTVTWRAANPEGQDVLDEVLEIGENTLKLRADYTVEGVPPKEITTPAGTFTDVVGVSIEYENIEILNANEEGRSDLDEWTEYLTDPSYTPITWYARDVGVVQEGLEIGSRQPRKLEGCEG